MTKRRDSRAEEREAPKGGPVDPAVATPVNSAQDREALIALVRAIARDAARADHAGRAAVRD